MPSKGVDIYSYVSPALPEYSVSFSVPGKEAPQTITRDGGHNFTSDHLEVSHVNLASEFSFVGRFSFTVRRGAEDVTTQWNDINTLTGNLHAGTMMKAVLQESITASNAIITYGFYDAGHGEAGLPSSDQCYVTVAPTTHSAWMGALAPPGSDAARLPFSRFALPAPHDDGMNSMETCEAVLHGRDENVVAELFKHIPHLGWFSDHLSNSAIASMLPNIIYGVAITQKDTIPTLLALGARYFEFRPADLLPMFQDTHDGMLAKPHFQHACIPGLAFDAFLNQVVTFLDQNANEFVVMHFRWDNVVKECKRPTIEDIGQAIDEACTSAKANKIQWARGEDGFSKPIDELRASGTRILVVIEAEKYDSWTAEAYRTLEADSILARFEGMNTEGQEATDITVLQCQATSQSIKEVLLYSVLAANADTSCLTSTKARLDMQTLPWIRDNAFDRLKAEKLLVVMNDFLDGATTDIVIDLNRKRLGVE